MWLVVYKYAYYPDVYECKTLHEAQRLYDAMKKDKFIDPNDSTYINEDGKLYITEVKDSHGTFDDDVVWYSDTKAEYTKYEF